MARMDPSRSDRPDPVGLSGARVAPALPPAILPRERLVTMARAGLCAGLLRVVAPAGYGKTTLLALAVDGDPGPVAWTAAGVAGVGRSPVEALARDLAPSLPGLGPPPARGGGAARARWICEAITTSGLRRPLLVVDDANLLTGRGLRELTTLNDHGRDVVRLAVAARCRLPADVAGARPDAVTLGAAAMTVSAAECRELLGGLGVDLSDEEAAERAREAEGWIAGIVLGARPGGDAADYLLREVVEALPEPEARLLEATRVLERFTPEMAAVVAERRDAAELLASIGEHGGFVVADPETPGWLRLHRMMRAALIRRAATRPAAETRALHRRAAVAWTAVGEPQAAARHHVAAGDLSDALTILAGIGESGAARRRPVRDLLRAVPSGAWSDAPGPVLARASAFFYRAEYLGAFEAMEGAARALLAQGDRRRAAIVLVRLLRAAPLAGGLYDRTIATAADLLPRLGADRVLLPPALTMIALLMGESARYKDAEAHLATALEAGLDDDGLTGAWVAATRAFAIDFPQGRARQALAALETVIPVLEASAERDPLNYVLYAIAFRSLILADVGRFADALAESDRFRDAASRRGLSRLGSPVVSMLRFLPLAGLGDLDRLGTEIARSAPAFRRMGGALRGYRHDVAIAHLAAAQGDRDRVATATADAEGRLREHGLPYDGAMALADLSATARSVGLVESARRLAAEARTMAERAAAPWAMARAEIASAMAWGPGPEGDAALEAALRRSSGHRLDALWSRRDRGPAAALLPWALERGTGPADVVVRLAGACGGEVLAACASAAPLAPPSTRLALAEAAAGAVASDGALDRMLQDPEPEVRDAVHRARRLRRQTDTLAIHLVTLGRFAVERGGRPMPERDFGRQKARVLLAMLACAHGGVHREELVEGLWPELPGKRGLAALHSTLYALRRALEPHLSTGEPSTLIVAEGVSYRLVLDSRSSWDAAIFLRTASEALTLTGADAIPALARAERLYTGTFLPEWAFEPWSHALRTRLVETHRSVVAQAADLMAEDGRHDEAMVRYRLLLAMEPERESWHRALMRIYAAAGERAMAVRQFHACREVLREGLGVEPSRETRELHVRILREDDPGHEARPWVAASRATPDAPPPGAGPPLPRPL